MAQSFDRCGNYDDFIARKTPDDSDDEVENPHEFDPSKGIAALARGYRYWSERYLSGCAGQRKHKHHEKRMNKWDRKLQAHLDNAGGKELHHQ